MVHATATLPSIVRDRVIKRVKTFNAVRFKLGAALPGGPASNITYPLRSCLEGCPTNVPRRYKNNDDKNNEITYNSEEEVDLEIILETIFGVVSLFVVATVSICGCCVGGCMKRFFVPGRLSNTGCACHCCGNRKCSSIMLMLFVVVNFIYSSLAMSLIEIVIDSLLGRNGYSGLYLASTCNLPYEGNVIVCSCTAYESFYCGKLVDFEGPANCTVKRTAGQLQGGPGMHLYTTALIMTMLFSLVICCKPVDDDEIVNESDV